MRDELLLLHLELLHGRLALGSCLLPGLHQVRLLQQVDLELLLKLVHHLLKLFSSCVGHLLLFKIRSQLNVVPLGVGSVAEWSKALKLR